MIPQKQHSGPYADSTRDGVTPKNAGIRATVSPRITVGRMIRKKTISTMITLRIIAKLIRKTSMSRINARNVKTIDFRG
jgi:hypothetical protein